MLEPVIATRQFQLPDTSNLATALGPAFKLAFSPPHDYPMSVPMFEPAQCLERGKINVEQLRLYVHIPFCNYACTFCFFAKTIGAQREQKEHYVKMLKRELEWIEPGTRLSQLFVGGGTPTCLPPDLMDEVLSAIFSRVEHDPAIVHTLEASPESITEDHLDVIQKHGIGRISMGVQSLDQSTLDDVNRRHDAIQALNACKLIIDKGLILNIDLMYGLPKQTPEHLERDIALLNELNVPSLTLYDLRINEHTPIARKIDDQDRWDLDKLITWRSIAKQLAEDAGYIQTRWHTYKKTDSIAAKHERIRCFDDDGSGYQLGVGMSARSQLGYTMYRNTRNMKTYLERMEKRQSPVEDIIHLTPEDRKTQFVARSIGDGKPLYRKAYEEAFGASIDHDFPEAIDHLTRCNILEDMGNTLFLSRTGRLVYDLVTVSFYPEKAHQWLRKQYPDTH
jgi:oxygen-independent coproporphyrinogen-3 oxidase